MDYSNFIRFQTSPTNNVSHHVLRPEMSGDVLLSQTPEQIKRIFDGSIPQFSPGGNITKMHMMLKIKLINELPVNPILSPNSISWTFLIESFSWYSIHLTVGKMNSTVTNSHQQSLFFMKPAVAAMSDKGPFDANSYSASICCWVFPAANTASLILFTAWDLAA